MPRSGVTGTYTLPPNTDNQAPNTTIRSPMFNAAMNDVQQTFNTVQPVVFGGTGVTDLKLPDGEFGIRNSTDTSKLATISAANISASTTRTYDLPDASGTVGLVSNMMGHIYGLTLSNNVTDADNDIDIAAGAAVDSTGTVSMLLASALTKRLDAAWAVGTNQGGRMSAAALADTTYHVFLIRRPDTGVVDVGFDVSPTAPTLPTNYTQFRRIGSIVRLTGVILRFVQNGNYFEYNPIQAITTITNPGTAGNLVTTKVPTGIKAQGKFAFGASAANGTLDSPIYVRISDPATVDNAAAIINFNFIVFMDNVSQVVVGGEVNVFTDTSGRVRLRLSSSAGGTVCYLQTIGWVDTRDGI